MFEGTDYEYSRTTNKILEAFPLQKGVKPEDIMINSTPFGFSDWARLKGRAGHLAYRLLNHDAIVLDEPDYLPLSADGGAFSFHLVSFHA